jgi:hypothetical protein
MVNNECINFQVYYMACPVLVCSLLKDVRVFFFGLPRVRENSATQRKGGKGGGIRNAKNRWPTFLRRKPLEWQHSKKTFSTVLRLFADYLFLCITSFCRELCHGSTMRFIVVPNLPDLCLERAVERRKLEIRRERIFS